MTRLWQGCAGLSGAQRELRTKCVLGGEGTAWVGEKVGRGILYPSQKKSLTKRKGHFHIFTSCRLKGGKEVLSLTDILAKSASDEAETRLLGDSLDPGPVAFPSVR